MNKIILLASLIFLTNGCSKRSEERFNACTAQNPLEQVPWLKALKEEAAAIPTSSCGKRIERAVYQNKPVFYFRFTGGSCDRRLACDYIFSVTLLDCEGHFVRTYYGAEFKDFDKEVTNREVLFECQR